MILSVSRRTDIPAFYSDWFYNRIREGYACDRNPMNRHQVSKIRLSPDVIDCIVFWSKNPAPMLPRLGELADYMYYFQFTVTPYGRELETGLPQKEIIIDTFRQLSDRIGPKRVIWRYDPILFSQSMDVSYHLHGFEAIAKRLASHTQTCVISFVDLYQMTREIVSRLALQAEKRRIQVEVVGEHVECFGIRQILDEMIYNICENAIKYNKENGKVNIWVGNTLNGKKVIVQDTGIGIPKEHQDRIFERFYRVDKSHSRETGGTGLGLSIVKHGALLHNAEIHVESEEGKGTKMELIFHC